MATAAVGNADRNHQRSGGYYAGRDYCRAERAGSRLSHRAHCRCVSPASREELLFDELKFQAGEPASSRQLWLRSRNMCLGKHIFLESQCEISTSSVAASFARSEMITRRSRQFNEGGI